MSVSPPPPSTTRVEATIDVTPDSPLGKLATALSRNLGKTPTATSTAAQAWAYLNSPVVLCVLSGLLITVLTQRWTDQTRLSEEIKSKTLESRACSTELRFRSEMIEAFYTYFRRHVSVQRV